MKTLFTLLLILLFFSAKSQTKFTGIGIFKIGVDTSIIYSYAKSVNETVKPLDNSDDFYTIKIKNDDNEATKEESDKTVYRVIRNDDMKLSAISLSYCPKTTEFFINEYSVNDIHLYNVHLIFYENQLIEVGCNNSIELTDAMKIKYGKPVLTKTTKKITCVYKLTGIKEPKTETTYFEKWTNGTITAISLINSYFDNKCSPHTSTAFNYQAANKEYDACWRSHLMDDLKPKGSKEKLKDF